MSIMQSPLQRSFGRRRGRRLRPSRNMLFETLLPKLLIGLSNKGDTPPSLTLTPSLCGVVGTASSTFPRTDSATCNPQPATPLWLEIGFGGGEHLVEQARTHPEVNFIGCEPYVNGMASLLVAIDTQKLTNIRLYDNDARLLLEQLPDASLERLFVLFPDPWPKARHHKKRIIAQNSLELFYSKLTMGGLLRIATDHTDYCTWILEHMLAFKKFVWQAQSQKDWNIPPPDWIKTRYQMKAEAEGRKAIFMDWIKQ